MAGEERALNLAGVTDIDGTAFDASRHEWAVWDLFVFEPWFLIEGVLFIAAGAAALTTTQARERWTAGCLAAAGIATLTGRWGYASETQVRAGAQAPALLLFEQRVRTFGFRGRRTPS